MAGAGKKTFQVNEVLSAADVNQYLMDQSVMRFADDTARSSAIGTPSEGMVSYLDDTNQVEVYDGASWVNFTGDITQVTAGTALTGGGTEGNVTLNADISAISTAQAGTALTASGETLNVDETELFTGGTAGYTALSNGTAGLSYQPVSHNYIINGAFDIWQRGTSFAGLTAATYTTDRWEFLPFGAGQPCTVSRQDTTPPNGFTYYSRIVQDSVNITNAFFVQSIETENSYPLAGMEVTLSFYYRIPTSWSGSWVAVIKESTTENSSPTDLLSESTVSSSTLTNQTDWTFATVTGTVSSTTKTIGVHFSTTDSTVSGATFEVTGVQLEAGSIATPFKRNANSIQGELAACQRYYYRFNTSVEGGGGGYKYGIGGAVDMHATSGRFPVTMRTAPSLSVVSGGTNNLTNCSSPVYSSTAEGFLVRVTVDSTGSYRVFQDLETSGAEL